MQEPRSATIEWSAFSPLSSFSELPVVPTMKRVRWEQVVMTRLPNGARLRASKRGWFYLNYDGDFSMERYVEMLKSLKKETKRVFKHIVHAPDFNFESDEWSFDFVLAQDSGSAPTGAIPGDWSASIWEIACE